MIQETPAIATVAPAARATFEALPAPAAAWHSAPMTVHAARLEAAALHGVLAGLVIKETTRAPRANTTEEGATDKRMLITRPLQDGVVALAEHLVASVLQLPDGFLHRFGTGHIVALEGDDPGERLRSLVAVINEPAKYLAVCTLAVGLQDVDRQDLVCGGERLE